MNQTYTDKDGWKNSSGYKSRTRNIDVWATPEVCIEREGASLSLQMKVPQSDGSRKMFGVIVPFEVAMQLNTILPLAVSVPGHVVKTTDIAPRAQADGDHGLTEDGHEY